MPCHVFLYIWLELPPVPEGGVDLVALKAKLNAQGVNGRGWRLYLDYGDALFNPLSSLWLYADQPAGAIHNAVIWLKLLQACEMDVLPPPALVRSLPEWGLPGDQLALLPPLLLRAAWKACVAVEYVGGDCADFIAREIVSVAQRFFACGDYEQVNQQRLKSGWDALKRHYQPPVARQIQSIDTAFSSPVPRVEWGRYRFDALETVGALADEGGAMMNCIGTYGERLSQQMLIAYSVRNRKTGTREATMTVAEVEPGRWVIDEIEGPGNTEASDEIVRAAFAVVRVLEEAYFTIRPVRENIQAMRRRSEGATSVPVPVAVDPCEIPF